MIDVRSILNKAVQWEKISRNPAKNVDLPMVRTDERPVLTPKQVLLLIKNAPLRERAIIALAAFSGLREAEIFGLQWEDISFKTQQRTTIQLRRQYTDGHLDNILKTKRSSATIQIWEKLSDILREWQLKNPWSIWVFPGKGTGRPLHPITWQSKTFKKQLRKNNLPNVHFHDLRHTFISLLLNENASIEDVQKIARHSNISTTIGTYSHISPKRIDRIIDLLNRVYVENDVENGNEK